jgi:hypothetical protein
VRGHHIPNRAGQQSEKARKEHIVAQNHEGGRDLRKMEEEAAPLVLSRTTTPQTSNACLFHVDDDPYHVYCAHAVEGGTVVVQQARLRVQWRPQGMGIEVFGIHCCRRAFHAPRLGARLAPPDAARSCCAARHPLPTGADRPHVACLH